MAIAEAPRATSRRRPVVVSVPRSELVGAFMDCDTLASEAMFANGATLQLLRRLPPSAAVEQALLATHDTHDRLVRLLASIRQSSGHYDGRHDAA